MRGARRPKIAISGAGMPRDCAPAPAPPIGTGDLGGLRRSGPWAGPRLHDGGVGALVTLELPADSPVLELPWVITFGPLDDEGEWEPVVCGPYERVHALALAQAVVADVELMAVVEPIVLAVSVEEIRDEIAAAQRGLTETPEEEYAETVGVPETYRTPSPQEVRAGVARIAAKLAAG